jgi:hypothetical protein
MAPYHAKRFDHWSVECIVGAEVQRVEQSRNHAAVVSRIGAADRCAQALLVHRSGLILTDQIVQGLLAGDREHDLAHGVVGPVDGSLGDLEEDDWFFRSPS